MWGCFDTSCTHTHTRTHACAHTLYLYFPALILTGQYYQKMLACHNYQNTICCPICADMKTFFSTEHDAKTCNALWVINNYSIFTGVYSVSNVIFIQ